MNKEIISKEILLSTGLQYGHKTKRWNPKMSPYIAGVNNGYHIINFHSTIKTLGLVYQAAHDITKNGGKFMFVGTNDKISETIKENAIRSGSFYMNDRWLGGLLTNWKTVQKSIERLREIERKKKSNYLGYTKKEGLYLERELQKLEKTLGGIKYMRRLPKAIFLASAKRQEIVIKEAKKLKIPVFAICHTNSNPEDVSFPIPANDDLVKSVALVTTIVADGIVSATGGKQMLAFVPDEKAKIIGLTTLDSENDKSNNTHKFNKLASKSTRNNMRRNYSKKISTNDDKSHNTKFIKKETKE